MRASKGNNMHNFGVVRKIGFGAFVALALGACSGEDPPLPGERLSIRPESPIAIENRAAAISLPSARTTADWTHENGAPTHATPHAAFTSNPTLRWSVDIGQGISRDARLANGPVAGGGLIYVIDGEGALSAISPENGGVVWSTSLTPVGERGVEGAGGGASYANGVVYAATGYGEVVALNADNGGVIWRRSFEAPFQSAPTIFGNRLIAVTRADTAFGLDIEDGSTDWFQRGNVAASGGYDNAASPAVTNGFAVLPFSSGDMIVVEPASGQPRWRDAVERAAPSTALARFGELSGDPVISGGAVYAANISGETVKLNLTNGSLQWRLALGAVSPVVPVGGSVFLMSNEGALVRANAANGQVIWAQSLAQFEDPEDRDDLIRYYGPVLAGGLLWIAGRDGQLRGFAPESGVMSVSVAIPGGAAAAPIIVGGVMYILSQNGDLHAFQ